MFSTFYTPCQQLTRRAHVIVATLVTLVLGFGIASAQQLESEFISPLRVTDSPSVLFDKGLVELQVDDDLLQEMSVTAGKFLLRDFPVNEHEAIDLVIERFFPYRGDIHEAYFATDKNGNRVVRKRPVEITVKCFRGHVLGYPDSTVVFGMSKDMCNGFIEYGETKHTLSTDPATGVMVVSDPLAEQPGLQLVREMMREAVVHQGGDQGNFRGLDELTPAGCAQISLSVAYGADFLALFGGTGNEAAVGDYIVTLIGQVSEIFHRDGVIWADVVVSQITPGGGIVDTSDALADELCNFVEVAVGGQYPDPTLATGYGASDGILILRTTADGTLNIPNADLTKQSLAYFGGLTTGITPAFPNACPDVTVLNAVAAASGLIGATDTTGYDSYIVAQALGTLCGASPTGVTAAITALIGGPFGAAPSGAGTNLVWDNCDGGALPTPTGTIMSSCMLPVGSTMAANIDVRLATANAIAMNAFLTAPPGPLVNGGALVPAPIVTVAATQGGAGNCTSVNISWTPDPAATAEYVFRNITNTFVGSQLLETLPGGTGNYRDNTASGNQIYRYWVVSTNACNIDDPFLIADQYNPLIAIMPPTIPITYGQGVPGNTGGSPPPLMQVMATVYESCDTITVTWDLSLPLPGGYPAPLPNIANIFRNTVDSPPVSGSVPIASVAMSLASYSDNDPALIQDTTYYYWVTPSDSNCDVPDPPVVGDSATGILQPNISGETIRAGATNNSECLGVNIAWVPDPTLVGPNDHYNIFREDQRFPGIRTDVSGDLDTINQAGVPRDLWGPDDDTDPGVQYEYWVIATNDCSESLMAVDGALGMTAELERPLGVQVIETDPGDPTTPACGNIEIRWDEVMNADAYEVWRSTIDDYFNTQTPPTSIGTTTDVFFVDSPPVSGQIYYYWVASVSYLCPNPPVIPLSTTVFGSAFAKLVQPTNLTASNGTDCDQIHVEWGGDFDGTTYIVSRNTVDTFATAEVVGEIDDLGYFHDPLDGDGSQPDPLPLIQYYYWVVASNECGTTVESNSDSGSRGVLLVAPEGLDATEGTFCPGIQVSWVPRVLADKYRIYRDTLPNPDPDDSLYIGETLVGSSSTYNDATAIPGYSYYYWVEAVSNCSIGAPILQDEPAEGMNGAMAGPTGMSATNGTTCGFVELSWDEVPLASNYVVWSSLDDDFQTAVFVGNSPIPLFQDDSIADKTLTYYWVTTDTQFCTGTVQSAGVSGWALTEVAVVTGVVAGQGSECTELLVTWNPINNIWHYDVYRNQTGVEPDPAIDIPVTTTEAIFLDDDPLLVAGIPYYYWVRATTSCGVSDNLGVVAMGYLAEDNITAPFGVGQVDSTSCSTILIEWQPVEGATGYDVYRGVTVEFGESAFQGNTTDSPYPDSNVTDGQTYFYWIKATNACGGSAESASASGVTLTLNSPVITDITSDECGVVNMSWSAVADVDEYHVYYSQYPNPFTPPANYLGPTTATDFTDEASLLDTPLYYWVLSVVDHNNLVCVSQWGSYATGMALAPTSPPHDVHASVNEFCNIIRLNWISDNIGATTHSIHRHDTDDVTLSQLIGTTSETQFDDLGDVGGIVLGTTYYYWVKSETSCEVSDFGLGTSGWTQVPPVNPTNVNATDTGTSTSCDTVDISWQPDPTADTYLVWRSPVDVNNPLQIEETPLTNFQDSVVEPGGIYTYWVTSKNNCGPNDVEIGVTISDDGSLGQLVPPLNVSATDGGGACGQIDVSWDTVPLASGYKVYRSDTADFAGALHVGTADGNAFTDVGTTIYPMDYDTPYYYFVQSVNQLCQFPSTHSPAEVGHSLPSHTIPTGVTATLCTSCENIWINWTVGPNDQTYDIYRNLTGVEPDPDVVDPLNTDPIPLPPYVDDVGAGDTNTYFYWVRAINSCPGFSDLSENTSGVAAPVFTDSPSASATQGTDCFEVEVSWDQLQCAVVYHIYRNVTDNHQTANNIGEGQVITTSPWQDVNALAGETYFYWVTAENDCGESPKDASGQLGWVGVTAQPSSVTATNDGCNMTTITWEDVFDATRYDVYRNPVNDFGTSEWAGFSEVTQLDDFGAAPAVAYYYWVTASSGFCGESSPSSPVTGYSLPGIEIPTNVVATQESLCDEIRLTWDASNQNVVTTYTVYRSPDSDIANSIQLSPTTTDTTFLDDDPLLVAGIQYYYWITGTNSCGTSPDSIVASGTAGDGADSPTIVTATDSGLSSFCNAVVITWAASSGATSYMVYRNVVDNAQTAEWIDTTPWPMSIDSTALPAITYYYWVTSVTSCGESLRDDVDNSDSGSFGQLAPPNDLLASDPDFVGCGSVELTWTPVEYATAYYVYRSTSPSFPGPDGLIGLAEGDTYLDNQFDEDQFNVPLYYWLESVGEYCDSPTTHSQLAEGLARPPLIAPTTVRSSDGTVCDEVWIDWDEDVNALYFEVWRNTVENSANAELITTDPATAPTTNVYVDSGSFDPDTDYYYWVKTVNTCGTSSFSNSDIGYPADIPSSPIISVTQGSICDSITLNWGAIPTANRYQIFRSEIVDEEFPQYMEEVLTPLTTWTDVNVIPDVDYYYWVAALNDCTTSGTSGDGKRGWIGELAAPTNVQASQLEFCGGITITWDVVANAINYNLYRLPEGPDGDDETQSVLIGNSDGATSFVDSNIDPSNQYYYWVKSVNYTTCGESDFSSSSIGQSLPPVIVPSEVSATFNVQCGQITIAWVHDEPLTTYTVLRNTVDSVGGAVTVAINLTDTIFVDTQSAGEGQPFTSGIPYFYWVVANNSCGDSDYSQPAALGQAGDDPAQPTGLTASPTCNAVILNWTPVEGASWYQLGRRTSPTGTETVVYDGNQTTHTDLEVIPGISYYYEVTAINSCSPSPASDQTSSSATGSPPPTGISATDGTLNCLVSVTWDSVEDATNYKIYRGTDSDVTNTYQIGQQLQSPFIDPSPLPLAYYFVRAITPGCGEGGFSSGDIGSPFEGLPNPGGVNATNGTICGGITISWDTVSGASTYCVYRSVSGGPQTAILQACNISGQSWLDDDISIGVPYWYWVTSESSGDESCNLGVPDQGWSSESLGGIQNLTASQCNPNYIEVEWYGVNSCFDVKRGSTVIATCTQDPYIDFGATGTHNYYVRPRNSCGELGTWEGPVVGILASCLGNDLPEGLLGTEPGDPTILIVPPEINNASKRKGPSAKGTSVGDSESKVNGDDPSIATPPWSLCLVGDAEITTSPILNLDESKWSLPLGGNWRLVGREGYADLFFLGGSDWEHVRSLRVEEIESGIAQSLLEDGIAAVVGTVPEAGTDVLITGVSHEDCDKDGIPDGCEILLGLALDMNIDGVPDSCAADINADGIVDSLDLLEVLEHFGSSINMYGDVTGDGVVDQSDVLAVLMEMSY